MTGNAPSVRPHGSRLFRLLAQPWRKEPEDRGALRNYPAVMRIGMVGTRRAVCVDYEQTVEAASYAMRMQKIDQVVVTEGVAGASVPNDLL